MKRKIFLIAALILLTGCSANVNINVDKDKIKENIEISSSNMSEYNSIKNWKGFPLPLYYDQELENPFSSGKKEDGVPYYEALHNPSNYSTSVTGEFAFKEHTRSSIIRNCFSFYNISENNNNYIFSTSNGVICKYNKFKLTVTTPYVIVENNANYFDKENNSLTWNVNESNARKTSIYFEIDFSKKANPDDETNSNSTDTTLDNKSGNETNSSIDKVIYIIIGLVVISITILFLLKRKKDKISNI